MNNNMITFKYFVHMDNVPIAVVGFQNLGLI